MNWIRANDPPTTAASVSAASVFARPGTDSSRQWPRHNTPTSKRSNNRDWPTITFRNSKKIFSKVSAVAASFIGAVGALLPLLAVEVPALGWVGLVSAISKSLIRQLTLAVLRRRRRARLPA